jgi:hypothetical protein
MVADFFLAIVAVVLVDLGIELVVDLVVALVDLLENLLLYDQTCHNNCSIH